MVVAMWIASVVLLAVFFWAGVRVTRRRTTLTMVVGVVSVVLLGGLLVWDLFTEAMPHPWSPVTGLALAAIGVYLALRQRGSGPTT